MLALALGAAAGHAQSDPAGFPAAANRFLDTELPAMEAAVVEQDRTYFEDAVGRTVAFADQWGFKSRANPALAGYQSCTTAVSDFMVVGLCRLTPSASECTPQLRSGFEREVAACRALAGR